jgi:hypothetical protein
MKEGRLKGKGRKWREDRRQKERKINKRRQKRA